MLMRRLLGDIIHILVKFNGLLAILQLVIFRSCPLYGDAAGRFIMNIYFYTTNQLIGYRENTIVFAAIQQKGAMVYSNVEGMAQSVNLPKDLDAVIVLDEGIPSDAAYVVALSIARGKPILYLLKRGLLLPVEIQKLGENRELKKRIKIVSFTPRKLALIIYEFLDQYLYKTEKYEIKFTLRLNTELERYVKWKSKKAKLDKATFVRKLIEDMKKEDEDYKKEK